MTDTYDQILSIVETHLSDAVNTGVELDDVTKQYLARRLTFHLNCLGMRQPPIDPPQWFARALCQMTRHVLSDGVSTLCPSRLRSLQAYVEAVTCFPDMLDRHPSVSAVIRAWNREVKGAIDQVAAVPQPHRSILWESADAQYRLTELIHPGHLVYQGLHQRNCLVNAPQLMRLRHDIGRALAVCTPLWPSIEGKTARVFSLDTVQGPQASFHINNGLLIDAEAPKGALLNPTLKVWDPSLHALTFLAEERILKSIDTVYFRTEAVANSIAAHCEQRKIRLTTRPSHLTTGRDCIFMPTPGNA